MTNVTKRINAISRWFMVLLPNWNKMEKLNCLESNKHDFLNSIRKMTKASHYWHICITDYENAPLQRSINWWSNGNTVYIRQKKNLTSLKQFSYTFQSDVIERDYLISIAVSIFSLVCSCVGIKGHFCLLRLRGERKYKSFCSGLWPIFEYLSKLP